MIDFLYKNMAGRSFCKDSRLFVIAETTRGKLASTRKVEEEIFPFIAWI